MEAAANAKDHMGMRAYDDAIEAYTKAIAESPTAPAYYLERAVAHHKLRDYTAALADSEQAILLALNRGNKSLRTSAQYRRGLALYCLGRYHDAWFCLKIAKREKCQEKAMDIWLAKVESACKGCTQKTLDVSEIPSSDAPLFSDDKGSTMATDGLLCSGIDMKQEPVKQRIRHDWYEAGDRIIISLYIKEFQRGNCEIQFEPRQIVVKVQSGSEMLSEEFEPLSGDIVPEESSFRLMATKVEISARKSRHEKWATLLGSVAQPSTEPKDTLLRAHKKDWDNLTDYADEEPASDGDAALTDLFQTLYKDADEDTKKAMIKSYTESGGTSLSTDWNSVKHKKVEIHPPDGMQARQYRK